MNFLRRLIPYSNEKATEIHKAIVKFFGLTPNWTKRDYENFSKEGYNANVWVFRCIQAVAQGAASVPWQLFRTDSKGKRKEIFSHDLLKLLYNPNEFMSKNEFIEAYVAYALISGNSYLDMVRPRENAAPRELWPLRPDRVSVIPHQQFFVSGYEYQVGDQKILLDRKRVSHLKFFNPIDDFYGLSPIEVAARGIDNDNAANAWNNALLNNAARPSGAMTTEGHLSDPQYDRLKGELDKNYKGARNAGKFMLLEGGLKWQEMGLSPKDMDFINSKKMSRVEICAAFNVPPEVVGDKEHATYSNYQEARKALFEDAVLPALDKVRDKLNADLVPFFGDNLWLDYNKDAIEVLQENRDQVYKRAREAFRDDLLTKNEARLEMGYDEVENGDKYYSELQAVKTLPEPEEIEEEKSNFFLNIKAFNIESDEQREMFFKSMVRRRATYYKRMAEKVANEFKKEHKRVLAAYKNGGIVEAENAVNAHKERWHKLYAGLYVEVMRDFGEQLLNQFKNDMQDLEIKAEIPPELAFNVFDNAVQEFIATTVAKKVVLVSETTKQKIRDRIAAGEAEGESIYDIADRLDELYLKQIIPNRSIVIARTEVIGASNAGNRYAAIQTGLTLEKEWVATYDDRTRDSHSELDGQKRAMDETYSNGLLYPGDPTGAADEVIQCRCTEVYRVIE